VRGAPQRNNSVSLEILNHEPVEVETLVTVNFVLSER